jgi:hypothetical protein
MLDTISWQDFFTVVGSLLTIYYVVAVLLLYSGEITNIFKQKRRSQLSLSDGDDHQDTIEHIDVLGQTKNESTVHLLYPDNVSSEELSFGSAIEDPEEIVVSENDTPVEQSLSNTITGLLAEIKVLAEVITDNSKEDLAQMFQALLERYPQLTSHQDSISQFIFNACSEQCTYAIEMSEVQSWWPGSRNHNQVNQ